MKRLFGHRYRRTTLVAVFCASVLGGIGLARGMTFDVSLLAVSGVLLLGCMRQRRLPALLAVVLLGVCVGGWRGTIYMDKLAQYEPIYNQKIMLVGTAVDDAGYGKQSQLAFDLSGACLNSEGQPLVGRISVTGYGAADIHA